jgi:hypothetical protein
MSSDDGCACCGSKRITSGCNLPAHPLYREIYVDSSLSECAHWLYACGAALRARVCLSCGSTQISTRLKIELSSGTHGSVL